MSATHPVHIKNIFPFTTYTQWFALIFLSVAFLFSFFFPVKNTTVSYSTVCKISRLVYSICSNVTITSGIKNISVICLLGYRYISDLIAKSWRDYRVIHLFALIDPAQCGLPCPFKLNGNNLVLCLNFQTFVTLCGDDRTFIVLTVCLWTAVPLLSFFPVGWFHYTLFCMSVKHFGKWRRVFHNQLKPL